MLFELTTNTKMGVEHTSMCLSVLLQLDLFQVFDFTISWILNQYAKGVWLWDLQIQKQYPESLEGGVEYFSFSKSETQAKRCRLQVKQCGRMLEQLNPSKEHLNLFWLLLASWIPQCGLLCIHFILYVPCILCMFIYINLLFFAAGCVTNRSFSNSLFVSR